MRDILQVTLREDEKQAQPGELADEDDEWFRPAGRGRAILGQRLVRTVAEGTTPDTSSGTENTEWVEPEPFYGSIATFASDREEGVMEAKRHTNKPGEMYVWMDRSRLNSGRTGASVVWCSLKWKTRKTYLGTK